MTLVRDVRANWFRRAQRYYMPDRFTAVNLFIIYPQRRSNAVFCYFAKLRASRQ